MASWALPGSCLLLVLGAALMAPQGLLHDPQVMPGFWRAAAVLGAGFALSWRLRWVGAAAFWGVAVLTRLLLLPMEPSDDIWRYLWEGQIQRFGFNPFLLAPDAALLEPLRTPWWGQINHPDVTAIYPPLTQLLFRLLAALSPADLGPAVLPFKLAFVAADLALCALLARRFGRLPSLLYAWNPLVLVSIAGGGHFESWFLLPLVGAWLLIEPHSTATPSSQDPAQTPTRLLIAALLVGLSVAIKWVSLPMLGLLLWRAIRERGWGLAAATALLGVLPMALASLPFCGTSGCPLIPVGSNFVRQGRSAELVPHLVGQLWGWSRAHNSLFLGALAAVALALILTNSAFGVFCRRYLMALLLLSPIVHGWYFTWLMPFAVPTRAWGARLLSLSGFVYFVLPSRLPDWNLSGPERWLLWGPWLIGLALEMGLRCRGDPAAPPKRA